MLFARVIDAASITSTAPGAAAMATYTRLPSLLIDTLFGCAVSGTDLMTFSVFVSTMSSVFSVSLVMYNREPSGADVAPWFTSMPLITPTTVLVAGSIRWTVVPAEFV